jgi:threonine/homoserine/homoserine lactone efflux protein
VLAAVGVSALIASSPVAFTVLKVCGGLYLVWLGLNALRSSGGAKAGAVKSVEQSSMRLFFRGVFANAINPKVVLFFLSFLPQFVVPAHGKVAWQIVALGVTFTVQAAVLFGLLGYFSGTIGQWLNARPRAGVILDRLAGGVFIALGIRLLVAR